jgi:glutamate-1-semialdehyde 2,1-aminomutase
VAAIIFQGNDIAPPEFVHGLKELSEKYSTLLVFDEVVSGFRWSESGSQGHYGVTPDLSTFAKILAGGLPGGCVGGRAEIIDTVGEQGIRHPGTFNANPLSAASGSTALGIVAKEPIITTAHKQAERLRDGINRTLTELEIPGGAYGMSSIVMVSLGEPVDTSNPYAQPDTIEQGGRPVANAVLDHLHTAIINEGLWTNPASMILSSTHTDDDIDETVTRYSKGLQAVRKLGML